MRPAFTSGDSRLLITPLISPSIAAVARGGLEVAFGSMGVQKGEGVETTRPEHVER